MRLLFYIFIILMAFTSCSHSIHRTGYNLSKSYYKDCDIVFKKTFVWMTLLLLKLEK